MLIDTENKRFTLRQSWMDTFTRCPEEARHAYTNPEADWEGDAAMAGTAAHAAIEAFLAGNIGFDDMADHARQVARHHAIHGVDHDGEMWPIQYKSFESADEMIHWAGHCTVSWQLHLYPWMRDNDLLSGQAEARFEYDAFTHRGWTVAHQGTVDWVPDHGNLMIDWKTAKSRYSQKDKQKWAVQPSAYAMAAANGEFGRSFDLPLDFYYGVMVRLKTKHAADYVHVQRTQGHIDWYNERCRTALDMFLDLGVERRWPMIDEKNYLCSEKWCPNYSGCRGMYVDSDVDLFGYNG